MSIVNYSKVKNFSFRVVHGSISSYGIFVDFAKADTFIASGLLQTAAETTNSREAVKKFNRYNFTYPSVEIPVKSRLLKLIEYPVIALRDRFHKNSSADSKKAAATNSLRLQKGLLIFSETNVEKVFL